MAFLEAAELIAGHRRFEHAGELVARLQKAG